MKKRFLSFILTFVMVLAIIPATVQSVYAATNYSLSVSVTDKGGYANISGSLSTEWGDATGLVMEYYIDGTYHDVSGSGKSMSFNINFPLSAGSHTISCNIYYKSSSSTVNQKNKNVYSTTFSISKTTATFDKQGGNEGSGSASATVNYGAANPTITIPTKTGYDFQGYYTGKGGTGTKYWNANGTSAKNWAETGGKTLYAYWTPHKYTLTLDNTCGEYIKSAGSATAAAVYTKAVDTITPPEKYGYTFTGYWTTTDETGTQYYNADGTSANDWYLTQDTTLYAHWTANTYSIEYYDGSTTISGITDTRINDSGYKTEFTCEENIDLPTKITKEGAIFDGWYESSSLEGNPVTGWTAHDKTQDQKVYSKWTQIVGTRADSEKQGFAASIFDSAGQEYSTANVTVKLDGTPSNVNQVQLKKDTESYTMGGTNGAYSYTTSDNVSGTWRIWVNGMDSGLDVEFNNESVTVNMFTAAVTVKSDDKAASDRNVILKAQGCSDLTLSESNSSGVYTLQSFAQDQDYAIYIDGEDTGFALNLKDADSCKQTVEYYTASVTTKLDSVNTHMGAVELVSGSAVLALDGSKGSYTLNKLKDDVTSYDLYVDGSDTGYDIKFTSKDRNQTVNYHTVTVNTKKDDALANINGVTLRDQGGAIKYTLNANSTGVYTAVSQESAAGYNVFVGSDNTGLTASFTEGGKAPADVNYYTAVVNTTKDGAPYNMGTVLLKNGTSEINLPNTASGKYSIVKPASDTSYDVYVGGESVGQTAKFTAADRECAVSYTSIYLTTRLDDQIASVGAIALKNNSAPAITMNYSSTSYTAVTYKTGSYDVYLDGIDTGEDLTIGTDCTMDYYTLSYDLASGSAVVPPDKIYLSGTKVQLPENTPTKDGYQFGGWSTDGTNTAAFAPTEDGSYSNTDSGKITIGSTCHSLTAVWISNDTFEARYRQSGTDDWCYCSIQYAMGYAGNNSDSRFTAELLKDATVTGNPELPSNITLTVPTGKTLSGDFVNKGSINLQGTLSGTVTNEGTINGGGTVANDVLSGAGTVSTLVNSTDGAVKLCNVSSVTSNGGVLTDCCIDAASQLGGTVNGTIYAKSGVTFADTLSTRSTSGGKTIISIEGGGTINSTADINGATAFAGLMVESGGHYVAASEIHLRNKLTITNNQIYADFFDFTAPSVLICDGQEHATTFSSIRTAGVGEITKVLYRYVPVDKEVTASNYTEWTEALPKNPGTYQVMINVADGEYYKGKDGIVDTAVWTFIIKKPVVALWKKTAKTYTGTQLDPGYELTGIETIHSSDVSMIVDDGARIDAAAYDVSASLTGSAIKYYELTNPDTAFTIQKAPVTFTVSSDSQQYDGTSKSAVITAQTSGAAFTSFTAVYKDGKGQIAATPTAIGDYGIYATITDSNYRFEGYTDGSQQRVGTLSIYKTDAPKTYSLSFDGGAGAIGSMTSMAAVKAGESRILPECSFTSGSSIFAGWKLDSKVYQAGEIYSQPAKNITASAVWTDNVYTVSGTLKDSNGNPQENAVITLMSGARRVAQAISNSSGAFGFNNVLPGTYNIVTNYNGTIVTSKIVVSDSNIDDVQLTLPAGRMNSVVEVSVGTVEVVVSGLENSFDSVDGNYTTDDAITVSNGGTVEFKLAVAENENPSEEKQNELKKKNSNISMYLDLNLSKTVKNASGASVTNLYSSDSLIAVTIPLSAELQGKDNYLVYRYHSADGSIANENLVQMKQLYGSSAPTEEGYVVSSDKKSITVYTKYFSLYAIGYVNNTYSYDSSIDYLNCKKDSKCIISQFTDADPKAWYHDGMHYCLDNGYISGLGNNKLAPSGTLTRAQAAMILWNISGNNTADYAMSYLDVDANAWYGEAVRWASSEGIIKGYSDGSFKPNKSVTREELAQIFYGYAKKQGQGFEDNWSFLIDKPDADKISGWASEAMHWMVMKEIMNGDGNGLLNPQGTATRAEASEMIQRFCEALQ